MSARNRELFGLIPAALLLTGGFAAVFIQEQNVLSDVSLTYGAIFLGLCLAAHVFLRFALPQADPYLFPLVALLACFGLVVIYRIDDTLAREQAQWFVIGLIAFAAVILFVRDYRVLERYRYTIAFVGLGLLVLPRLPGIGAQVNGEPSSPWTITTGILPGRCGSSVWMPAFSSSESGRKKPVKTAASSRV